MMACVLHRCDGLCDGPVFEVSPGEATEMSRDAYQRILQVMPREGIAIREVYPQKRYRCYDKGTLLSGALHAAPRA